MLPPTAHETTRARRANRVIAVEEIVRAELERLVEAEPDWDAIAVAAGLGRDSARRRRSTALALLMLAVAVAGVGAVSPLGAAIARELGGFSTWLTGQPGKRVPAKKPRAFEAANARSWAGFPRGSQLRHLLTRHVGGTRVELVRFRSGPAAFVCG